MNSQTNEHQQCAIACGDGSYGRLDQMDAQKNRDRIYIVMFGAKTIIFVSSRIYYHLGQSQCVVKFYFRSGKMIRIYLIQTFVILYLIIESV